MHRRGFLVVALVMFGQTALASDRASPGGFRTSLRAASTTLAHDGQGLELRDVSVSAGASGSRQCFDTSGETEVAIGSPRRHPPSFPWIERAVFAPRPGGFVAFGAVTRGVDGGGTPIPDRIDVADFDCATGFTNIRAVEVPTVRRTGGRSPGCLTPDDSTVVTPDLHLFSKGDGGYCHWNPATSTFTLELQHSTLDPLLTPLALDALHEAFGDTLPTTNWTATSIIGLPDGSLWSYVLLFHPGVPRQSRHDFRFIVRRAPDGSLSTIGGLSDGGRRVEPPVSPWLHHDPTSGRVLGVGYANDLAVWNPATPSAPAQFANAAGLDFSLQGTTDHVPLGPGPRRFRLVLDDTAFDGDLDGRTLAEEPEHDTTFDTDGDGAGDGYEVNVLGTDPLDPLQPALTAAQRSTKTLAPSLHIDDWMFLHGDSPAGPVRGGEAARVTDGVLCSPVVFANKEACFEGDGTQRDPWPLPTEATGGEFVDDGACLYIQRGDETFLRRDAVTGVETVLFGGDTNGHWPASCDTVYYRRLDNTIVRLSPDGEFTVVDVTRECPVAGNAAELTGCEGRRLGKPAYFSGIVDIFGIDPDTKSLVVAFDTHHGRVLAAIDRTHARHLVDVAALHRDWPLRDLAMEPGGRRFALLGNASFNFRTDELAVVALSGGWAPIANLDAPIPTWRPTHTDRPRAFGGLLASRRLVPTYVILDPVAASSCPPCCACGPGAIVCQVCNPQEPPRTATWDVGGLAQWHPIEPGLQPGELVFAGVAVDLLSTASNAGSQWGLFRSTIDGAVSRFLDLDTLARIANDADRREMKRLAPASVTSLGASADGSKLCFVDRNGTDDGDERAWTVTLDTQRRPSHVAISKRGPYAACTFDDDGTLALLRHDGALEVGDRTLGATSAGPKLFPLVRTGGRWLAQDDTGVRCLDDDGAQVGHSVAVTGFAPGPHGLIHFTGNEDDLSWGGAATLADFCAGKRPTDTWFDPTKAIYDVADEAYRFSGTPVRTDFSQLAVRPDGVIHALLYGVRASFPGMYGPAAPLWRMRPAWIPADPTGRVRLEVLDPVRRVKPLVGIHQVEASVQAMVTLPGGDAAAFRAADDWEYKGAGVPAPPTYPIEGTDDPDGGVSDGGNVSPEPPPGCGCGGGPMVVAEALFALGFVVRRRRTGTTSSIHEQADS